jgi:hypothetical protein
VFIPLMLGSLLVVGNTNTGLGFQTRSLGVVVLVLFLGHVLQFAVWAWLFLYLGEFEEFATAFYHSAVNFTSLGYGDIVMSERWRLLGGLEAANGVLMFGLSAGAILSIMNRMMLQHLPGRSRLNRGAGNE